MPTESATETTRAGMNQSWFVGPGQVGVFLEAEGYDTLRTLGRTFQAAPVLEACRRSLVQRATSLLGNTKRGRRLAGIKAFCQIPGLDAATRADTLLRVLREDKLQFIRAEAVRGLGRLATRSEEQRGRIFAAVADRYEVETRAMNVRTAIEVCFVDLYADDDLASRSFGVGDGLALVRALQEILRLRAARRAAEEQREHEHHEVKSAFPDTFAELEVGQRLDARDHKRQWYSAQIVADDELCRDKNNGKEGFVRVHFDHFTAKWDECFSVDDWPAKLQPLHSKAPPTQFLSEASKARLGIS